MQKPLNSLPNDPELLKAIVLSLQGENQVLSGKVSSLEANETAFLDLISHLRLTLTKLRKQRFGSSSEKIDRQIEQLELALEHAQMAHPSQSPEEDQLPVPDLVSDTPEASVKPTRGKPRVRGDVERERATLEPQGNCPDCGGELRLIGEDVSELVEFITARLKVIETARPKKSCRSCEKIVQVPAPTRPIARSSAGASLLSHILVSKFDDQLPLYRQSEILERHGIEVPRSTLSDWCGLSMKTLSPLCELIKRQIMTSDRLHTDDTPVDVLGQHFKASSRSGKAKKQGRIWTYVRDDRSFGGKIPPIAAYWFSADRKAVNPAEHLKGFSGILQADAYAGYKQLFETGRIKEAACWAHWRRDFYDIFTSTKSELAQHALHEIGKLYDVERQINGKPPDLRREVRQKYSKPIAEHFKAWCKTQLARISGKSNLAKAIRYGLSRWHAFTLFLEDGRVAIDNNAAERAIKPVVMGRKNWMFAGSMAGGETLADAMTLIETAKFNGLNPQEYRNRPLKAP
ncbi:IS66 family transposase [Pseudovibrio sp. Tun.PSC04-5.I4]|uniref:IS66 family transposase n=1 Tax=Pseudovibrio sp. Tun.PSC04-5.I4 TaxID=1798213 RepID=UPI00087F59BE|nr:IS66 family transposase [Pseudovibrio sp. Tun.PSC04-5.I4]SDR49378.1 Transposase [Pseudovibrio sp. Tun.PSC04-5.I4]